MVNQCANPQCSKPLHYLREGRIFVFDVPDGQSAEKIGGAKGRRMEHYWLCGSCSETLVLKHSKEDGLKLLSRPPVHARAVAPMRDLVVGSGLAS